MRKWYRIESLINSVRTLNIVYHANDEEIILMSNAQVKTYIENVYGGFLYKAKYDPDKTKTENITLAKTAFLDLWDMHFSVKQKDIDRFFTSLYAEYDPIGNFRIETKGSIIDESHNGHKDTVTYNVTDEESSTNNRSIEGGSTDTTTPTLKTRDTQYVAGADSTTGALSQYTDSEVLEGDSETVNQHNQTTEDEHSSSNTKTGTKETKVEDISDTVFDKSVKTFNDYVREGNTGNYTTQNLLSSELEIRKQNYIYRLLEEFISSFCLYYDPFDDCEVIE